MMQDIYGLAKWQHWKDLTGMSEEVARRKYCELVEKYLAKYNTSLGGISISQNQNQPLQI